MTENFKILTEFVKDISSETPDVQTYIFVKDTISKYHLDINIASKPLKNKLIEVNTSLKFQNKSKPDKKSYFEVVYASIIRIGEIVQQKKDLQKIILCDVQNDIYPKLEKVLLNLLVDSGYPNVKFEKKVDFNKLFNDKFN